MSPEDRPVSIVSDQEPRVSDRKWEIRDLPWATWRLGRKAVFAAIPPRAHVEMAAMRGWALSRVSKVPDPVQRNIESTFGDESSPSKIQRIGRRFSAFKRQYYLTRILPCLTRFEDASKWHVEGLEHLDEALALDRGAILVSAHLGHVKLIPPILRGRGYAISEVVAGSYDSPARRRERERQDRRASRFRSYIHQRTRIRADLRKPEDIPATLDVRPILDALSRNSAVLILGDGLRSAEFVRMSLLGKTYPYPVGFLKIGMMTGAPLLPTFAVDGERGSRIRIEIHPALEVDPSADITTNLATFANLLDRQLRKTPHLWHRWDEENCFERALEWAARDLRTRHVSSGRLVVGEGEET